MFRYVCVCLCVVCVCEVIDIMYMTLKSVDMVFTRGAGKMFPDIGTITSVFLFTVDVKVK